jgi:hypothetical protein
MIESEVDSSSGTILGTHLHAKWGPRGKKQQNNLGKVSCTVLSAPLALLAKPEN